MSEPTDLLALMKSRLQDLEPQQLDIVDQSAAHAGHGASGGHYTLVLVSPRFAGLNRVQRHRLVYDRLPEVMSGAIHALSMKLLAPGEA